MVTDEDDVLRPFKDRNQSFWLRSLSGFIDQHLLEFYRLQTLVKSRDTSGANDISISDDLIFSLSLKVLESFVIFLVQLPILISLHHELLHSLKLVMFQMFDLLVEGNKIHV
jgi:hypothetical protein